MSRIRVFILISINLVGLTVLVFAYPHFMVAPGALIAAHANLETHCFACHTPLRGAAPDRCISCHKIADIGLRTTKGTPVAGTKSIPPFHQGLTAQNCMACHTDHVSPVLASRARTPFSHALLNSTSRDNCTSCHTAPRTADHPAPTAQCTQCHSQNGWKPATIDHDRFFVLDKDHNASCTTCHTTNDRRQYTCYGCHEHTEANIRKKHIREGITNFTNCISCHKSAHGDARGGDKREGGKKHKKDDD